MRDFLFKKNQKGARNLGPLNWVLKYMNKGKDQGRSSFQYPVMDNQGLLINIQRFIAFEKDLVQFMVNPKDESDMTQKQFAAKAHFSKVRFS